MIYEVATITIKQGTDEAFKVAVAEAADIFSRAEGCKGIHLLRCIEEANTYDLLVRWETLKAHTVGFREGPLFADWRALVSPFFANAPDVKHYEIVSDRVDFS